MDLPISFLIYATLFRLAVIGAGVLIILLGYRLFLRGILSEGVSETSAAGGGFKLSMKNAAPGTSFALFGAALVSVMVIKGSPELVMESLAKADVENQSGYTTRKIHLRGSENEAGLSNLLRPSSDAPELTSLNVELLIKAGMELEEKDNQKGAVDAYRLALSIPHITLAQAAVSLNQIAWIYLETDRLSRAFALARLALDIAPDNPVFMDTLARIHLQLGELDEAEELAQQAVKLSPGDAGVGETLSLIQKKRNEAQ